MKRRTKEREGTDAPRLGAIIREARERHGLSQQGLATQLDLTDGQISRLERGQNTTDAERLIKLSRLLYLDAEQLLRLGGYTLVADELQKRSAGTSWTDRLVAGASVLSPKDIETMSRVVDQLRKLSADRAR